MTDLGLLHQHIIIRTNRNDVTFQYIKTMHGWGKDGALLSAVHYYVGFKVCVLVILRPGL